MHERTRVTTERATPHAAETRHGKKATGPTPGLKMVCATTHLERQVRSRGFAFYFATFGMEIAIEAERGYRLIGAECHAELVRAARKAFSDRAHPDHGFAVLDDVIRDLDPPRALRQVYAREHPQDFATRANAS